MPLPPPPLLPLNVVLRAVAPPDDDDDEASTGVSYLTSEGAMALLMFVVALFPPLALLFEGRGGIVTAQKRELCVVCGEERGKETKTREKEERKRCSSAQSTTNERPHGPTREALLSLFSLAGLAASEQRRTAQ